MKDLSELEFEVVVVGGGHAGVEAASAAARMGKKTLLLTHNIDTIGQMSCNPAIGGLGKSQLVKEIDALGGLMARCADKAGVQFNILNSSRGFAVQALRAQADRIAYKNAVLDFLRAQENLIILQQNAEKLLVEHDKVCGIKTVLGMIIKSQTVILTCGTFFGAYMHVGDKSFPGGRAAEAHSDVLVDSIRELIANPLRFKTGTPPRIDKRSVDFSKMLKQDTDPSEPYFSSFSQFNEHPKQIPCFITHTNLETHKIILDHLHLSPTRTGKVTARPPRYCVSLEDKVIRFAAKNSHQVFVEPEGWHSVEVYPNGVTMALPWQVQQQVLRSIKGFEQARMTRTGYFVEYFCFDPKNLKLNLETKLVEGLFFAGQINGTTGYEEAAAQGIIAGINAALKVDKLPPFTPKRHEAYIGVLLDDLVNKGVTEPYRMFTSRAEHRLMLREDNACLRLSPTAIKLGLLSPQDRERFIAKKSLIDRELKRLKLARAEAKHGLSLSAELKKASLFELIGKYQLPYEDKLIFEIDDHLDAKDIKKHIYIEALYHEHIKKHLESWQHSNKLEYFKIPADLNYDEIYGLSTESREKLKHHLPNTLGEAARISGVTPASISVLSVYINKFNHKDKLFSVN